ncbi:EIN3-binding F-box protein [Musa troglodytarum]|uniref:EIN3-binding F-box protein n=1 Tax=Musa troglodytarum TaxID=320322 RepID=A0A9E7JT87_9LILI|nr:EIN3-binding F-box protein [Musa troglodytarum]
MVRAADVPAKNCTALKNLELTHAASVGDHGLVILATRCLKLASLSLTACPRVTDRSLEAFSKHSTHLKSITVAQCSFITDYGILSIVVLLTKLETVKISSMKLGDGVLRAIARSGEQIKTLALEQVWGVSVTGYRCIGETTRLKGLSLDACTGLTDRCFRRLSPTSFARLKKVAIASCFSLTDWSLLALTELAVELENLHLDTFEAFTYRGLMIALGNCSRTLKVLTLVKCDFRGHGALEQKEVDPLLLLPLPAQCPMLQTVKLEECEGLGDGFIMWIGQACKSITDVSFVRMDSITDYGIKSFMNQLKGWNRISRVDLSGSAGVGNRSVWAVTRECKARLRSLVLRGCERVSDRGAAVITRRCTKLVELDLGGCSISDEAVEKVVGEDPPDLEVLSLAGCTGITDRSLDALDEYGGLALNRLDLNGCPGLSQFRVNFIKIYIDEVDY